VIYGNARVSSAHQNLDRQLGALRAERYDRIFREKASGRTVKGRPQLAKALDMLGTGDVLMLAEALDPSARLRQPVSLPLDPEDDRVGG